MTPVPVPATTTLAPSPTPIDSGKLLKTLLEWLWNAVNSTATAASSTTTQVDTSDCVPYLVMFGDSSSPTNSGKKVKEIAVQLTKKLNFEKIELEMEAIDCEGKTYSYLVENEVVYICVADASVGRGAVTAFLKHIQAQFEEQFGVRGKMTKLKLDMQRDFGAILKTHMEMLSSQGGMQKLEALRKDLDGVKDSMQHNIGKVLERGDKIDLLVDKSESLKFVPT
ncbi:hypothetical protein DYB37_000850 [Aphanomyces astaci]|uniref:Longin domain-containing protein n=1 Tax=Aphanomyces astaci TaxID=112090 RepID=A0A418CNJ9_APHAT|nr:hypothetical protein DYB35_000719 [Aphanomyces astaci]RHZ31182.1 hypothetical protein DYB37_000850 [Aphanomyces astaci]